MATTFCFALSVAWAGPHENAIRDLNMNSYEKIKIESQGIQYTVNYSSVSRDVDIDQIRNHIHQSTDSILNKARIRNLSTKRCRTYSEVNVYEIPYGHLNDRSKMTFIEPHINYLIDGLYDSKYSERGTATIFIASDVTDQVRKTAITHEISHYLSEITCMNVCSESFAASNE